MIGCRSVSSAEVSGEFDSTICEIDDGVSSSYRSIDDLLSGLEELEFSMV